MNDIKALVLCNNPIAIPGLREFLFYGKIAVVAIPARNKEMQYILQEMLVEANVPLILLDKKTYLVQLDKAIHTYKPDIGIMMTFPYIITPPILSLPGKGFLNFHYGLLPQCRGPHPILSHLLNNDADAGITIHKVDEGIDTGPVVLQEKMPIADEDTYGTLQSKLAYLGAKMAANLLRILSYGSFIPAVEQDVSKAAYYEKPGVKELTINWQTMTAKQIVRLVNAANPWNKGAGTSINNWGIGITEAEIAGPMENDHSSPGTILHCDKHNGLVVSTKDNHQLRINIVYTNEGFFSGWKMAVFQVKIGDIFI